MINKGRTVYACTECGAQASKWSGQCGDCGAWNTLQETLAAPPTTKGGIKPAGYAGSAGTQVRILATVDGTAEIRQSCGNGELDRVLGGGLVNGSVTLIGGDPGIGKSTLLLQVLAELATRNQTLYVSGEESPQQISLRAQRLQLPRDRVRLLPEICVEQILLIAETERPQTMVIDSIQTVFTERLQSAPGSVAQVRESAAQLVRFAKATGTALFLVGHVTKEGAIAGPRVLEHMVDTVLYFEGDPSGRLRVLRAVKNRYGPVNELGVFAMTERGLKEVNNPSAIFLSRHEMPVAGSVIMVTREGTRPLLVEIQALVDECHGNNPRRVTLGWNRTGSPCCWRCSTDTAAWQCTIRMCMSTRWAACESTKPPLTWRYCWQPYRASATDRCRLTWWYLAKLDWREKSGQFPMARNDCARRRSMALNRLSSPAPTYPGVGDGWTGSTSGASPA